MEDSTTYYRIPITATVRDTLYSLYGKYRVSKGDFADATLRIEAVSANGVVLGTDSMVYRITILPEPHRVTGGLRSLSPAEVAHMATVRVGFTDH
jgi:hypothetical protein